MHRVGLTGGIGSGKSSVAEILRMLGATIIDADAISRALTASGGLAIGPIKDAFGSDFITADGALDRDKMRATSYADANARRRLEAIVHPLVSEESARQEVSATASECRCMVFDIPLLVESRRWRQRVDQVLVIDCTPQVQITRVVARSGIAAAAVQRIIDSQASRKERLRAADIVIFNGGDSHIQLKLDVDLVAHRFGL